MPYFITYPFRFFIISGAVLSVYFFKTSSDSYADAIYHKRDNILYFKNLSSITSIFKGIYILYREATQEEVESFLQNDFIELSSGYNIDNIKVSNRKRIGLVMDTLSKFNDQDKNNIFSYIREYCMDLEYDENKSCFKIKEEDELKRLLYGIEQRYYTTLLGNEKRLANSIIKL